LLKNTKSGKNEINCNTKGVISGAGTEHISIPQLFSGVCVAQCSVFCVVVCQGRIKELNK
jgi:hypothetical protein